MVDQIAEIALQVQGFGGKGAGGFDGVPIFGAQALDAGGGQEKFFAADALDLRYPSVGIEFGDGEKFVAGLFDGVFYPQLVGKSRLTPKTGLS